MSPKVELRKIVRQRVKQLSAAQKEILSADVMQRLGKHPRFAQAKVVMLYYSLPDEVNTHEFVKHWAADKVILLPVVKGDDLELRQLRSDSAMCETDFHIGAPVGDAFTQFELIDLIVVPGVAFDISGHRMGRGRGFYDRFLSKYVLRNTYKLGVCFPQQIVDEVPVESHDICMNEVLV